MKNNLFLIAAILFFSVFGNAGAETNCDSQAKPALSCPTGYTMMCLPAGGDHWGCGKEANGVITEAPAQSTGVKSTLQTQVKVAAPVETSVNVESSGAIYQNNQTNLEFIKQRSVTPITPDTEITSPPDALGVQKVTVQGWDPEKKEIIVGSAKVGNESPAVTSVKIEPGAVRTSEDFENFAKNIVAQDENIKLIKLTPESTEVDYQYDGKLLGIIPVKALAKAFLDNEHRVKVKLPWYNIFLKKAVDFNTDNIQKDLDEKLKLLKLQDELQRRAQAVQALSNIMKAAHDTAKNIIQNIRA